MAISTAVPSSPLLSRTKSAVPASLESSQGMGATAANPYTQGHSSQSIFIRTFLGVLFAVGLGLSLTRVTTGVLLLMEESATSFWNSLAGFAAWQSEQVLAVFLGTLFAAAGRRQTLLLGLLIGSVTGFGTLSMVDPPANVPGLYFVLLPTWHIIAGVLGALLSETLWQPPSREKTRVAASLGGYESEQSIMQLVRRGIASMIFANVKWLRILIAAAVIILVLRFTTDAYNFTIRALDLRETVSKVGLQKTYLITLLQVMTVLIVAGLAGAMQNHGLAHGFWTGVIAGVVNLLLHVFLPKEQVLPVNEILMEIGWVFVLSIVAGGFGAMVLPPIIFLARKRRAQIKI